MRVALQFAQIGVAAMLCLAQQTTSPEAKPAAAGGSISGSIKDANGDPIAKGTITFTTPGKPAKRIESIKDGQYSATGLEPDKRYDILFEAPGRRSATDPGVTVAAGQQLRLDVLLSAADPEVKPETDRWRIALSVSIILLYLLSILVTRWYKIAKPSRNFLLSHIEGLLNDLAATLNQLQAMVPNKAHRVAQLETELRKIHERYEKPPQIIRQFLFWAQSVENASWITVHQIGRELAAYLSPPEAVHARLLSSSPRLKELGDSAATQIAAAIEAELNANSKNNELRSQLLAEATSILNDHSDRNYVSLTDWQNKAMWLILASCLFLILLAIIGGNVILFLAGATGGLLSRLMRTLKGSGVPIDYGASWTTLFLSPLFGAFCGWFGIGIIILLARPDVGLLGKVFTTVTWPDALQLSTLTMAFLLGFSERLFDSLIAAVQNQADTGGKGAPSSGTPAAVGTTSTGPVSVAHSTTPYEQTRQKIAAAVASGNADDKAKVIAFLEAMGQDADHATTPDGLTALAAKVVAVVGSDPDKQKRYMTEAARAGFAAS